MTQPSPAELRGLIRETGVHSRVYADPAIFALEMDRIFGRAWVFLAHLSQLPRPGDFLTTRIGRHSIIVSRHDDGRICAFHNRCPHRGAMITALERGQVRFFQCGYHDWTFHTDGRIRSVPLMQGYADQDKRRATLCLEPVARVAEYRGFVFGTIAADGPGLVDFLGPMTSSLDDLVDRSPEGEIEFTGGRFRQISRANWKLQIENLNDLMHAGAVHRSAVQAADAVTAPVTQPPIGVDRIEAMRVNGAPLTKMDMLGVHAYPRGHSYIGGLPRPPRTGPIMEQYRAALDARYGAERAGEILAVDRHINVIYPSLLCHGLTGRMMVIQPLAVDRTETRVYVTRPKGLPAEVFRNAVRAANNASSPANFVLPDDFAMYRRCQTGLESAEDFWVDFGRGAGAEVRSNDGGLSARGTHELSMRNAYRAWLDYMTDGAA